MKRPTSTPPDQDTLQRAYRCLEAQGFRDVEYLMPSSKRGWLRFSAATRIGQVVEVALHLREGDEFEIIIDG